MQTITVERSIWIGAPRERVWEAVTNPEQVAQWFVPNLPGAQMTRDDSGKVTIHMGEMGIDVFQLELVNPPREAALRSVPERQIITTYRLDEEQAGTRVTVTMSGFEALPEDAREDRLDQIRAGWEKTLENLKAYLASADLPFPHAYVSPLLGFWRESKDSVSLERSIWIKASRQRVWQALTDPGQIEQWFAPGTTFKVTGTGVGARLYVENPETGGEMYVQILEVVDPPHRLMTRSVPEGEEASYTTDWVLKEEAGGTRLTLIYSGYESVPDAIRWTDMEQNTFGFGMMLGNVKAVIEGYSLPIPQGF